MLCTTVLRIIIIQGEGRDLFCELRYRTIAVQPSPSLDPPRSLGFPSLPRWCLPTSHCPLPTGAGFVRVRYHIASLIPSHPQTTAEALATTTYGIPTPVQHRAVRVRGSTVRRGAGTSTVAHTPAPAHSAYTRGAVSCILRGRGPVPSISPRGRRTLCTLTPRRGRGKREEGRGGEGREGKEGEVTAAIHDFHHCHCHSHTTTTTTTLFSHLKRILLLESASQDSEASKEVRRPVAPALDHRSSSPVARREEHRRVVVSSCPGGSLG